MAISRICFLLFILIQSITIDSNAQGTIHGYVYDSYTNERVIGATVTELFSQNQVTTASEGWYSIKSSYDTIEVLFSYPGYNSVDTIFSLKENLQFDVYLIPIQNLDEVLVSARQQDSINIPRKGSPIILSEVDIKQTPVLLGEPDVLKVFQLQPGIQGGTEGTAGLFVRGGAADQNTIRVDGIELYNVNHVLGLFSTFSVDAIQRATLYKGPIPSRFNGRLSSALEIDIREGNDQRWSGTASIGLTSSRLAIDGPIGSRSTILVSLRRSYFDVIYAPFQYFANKNIDGKDNLIANFGDLFIKSTTQINERNKLNFTLYGGNDNFGQGYEFSSRDYSYEDEQRARWGNLVGGVKWVSSIGASTSISTVASFSRYRVSYEEFAISSDLDNLVERRLKYDNAVQDFSLHTYAQTQLDARSRINYGAGLTSHRYQPGKTNVSSLREEVRTSEESEQAPISATEGWAFVEGEIQIFASLQATIGLHLRGFNSDKSYFSLNPRTSLVYNVNPTFSLYGSYGQTAQYTNLLTNPSIQLPSDIFVPSTKRILPQSATYYTLGTDYNFSSRWFASLVGFYKEFNNQIQYAQGESFTDFRIDSDWQNELVQGTGRARGVELSLSYSSDKITTQIAYTLSKNTRNFTGVNRGEDFPFVYDRRHILNIFSTYKLSKRASVIISWMFSTGQPFSVGNYIQKSNFYIKNERTLNDPAFFDYYSIPQGAETNATRLTNAHRLDVAYTYSNKRKFGLATWSFGLYNAYSHKNPFFLRVRETKTGSGNILTGVEEVALLPVIPSVSYTVDFHQKKL